MSAINKASDDLKKLSKFLAGIIELVPHLDKMGSLEEALLVTEKKLEQAKKAEILMAEKIIKLQDQAADQANDNRNRVSLAISESNSILKEAGIKAAALLQEAGKQGQELIADAEAKVSSVMSLIEKLQEDKKHFEKEAAEQKRKLDLVNVELDKIKGKL